MTKKINPPIATERKTEDLDYEICVETAELLSKAIKKKDFSTAFYHIINCGSFLTRILERKEGKK
ncbi:MAG: hypothetical protein IKE23_05260 [Exiguobacterium sp.]|nr:hypothetical protein [Exiguobacterium sp.]